MCLALCPVTMSYSGLPLAPSMVLFATVLFICISFLYFSVVTLASVE